MQKQESDYVYVHKYLASRADSEYFNVEILHESILINLDLLHNVSTISVSP